MARKAKTQPQPTTQPIVMSKQFGEKIEGTSYIALNNRDAKAAAFQVAANSDLLEYFDFYADFSVFGSSFYVNEKQSDLFLRFLAYLMSVDKIEEEYFGSIITYCDDKFCGAFYDMEEVETYLREIEEDRYDDDDEDEERSFDLDGLLRFNYTLIKCPEFGCYYLMHN